jgi:hypothetical protein
LAVQFTSIKESASIEKPLVACCYVVAFLFDVPLFFRVIPVYSNQVDELIKPLVENIFVAGLVFGHLVPTS